MKLLILGGSVFLGRYLVAVASARGHDITLFNRGLSNPDLFPGIQKLRGERCGDLKALKDNQWDAVIDTSGQISGQVRAAAELLKDSVDRYTFISSISAYADFSQPGIEEAAPTRTLPPGAVEEEGVGSTYGARKALCEQAAEQSMPGRVLNIRPGLIVGPHDVSGRFAYWVKRVAKGGEILAPESPDRLLQVLDVRDLADWIIRLVEQKQTGTFNATGPRAPLTFGEMLEACKSASGSDARFTWCDAQFLLDHSVRPYSDLPFWIPAADKSHSGHFLVNSDKAFQHGLGSRAITETARDTFLWAQECSSAQHPGQTAPGLSPEREQELLRAWQLQTTAS